jgi:hypothetical protein
MDRFNQLEQDVFFAVEVKVEGTLGQADLAGDVIHGCFPVAVLHKQMAGRVQ